MKASSASAFRTPPVAAVIAAGASKIYSLTAASPGARLAALRFGFDLLRHHRALIHGCSTLGGSIDGEDARTYFRRIGGEEVFDRIFLPGLNGPVGGAVDTSSRVILMQVLWNLLVRGQWNLTDGVDRIPEAVASEVKVLTEARALHVEQRDSGVQVEAEVKKKPQTLRARAVIFALPGQLVDCNS